MSPLWLVHCLLRIFALHAACTLASQVFLGDEDAVTESNRHGAVASESKLCSQIGIDLMKGGGNAADAVSHVKLGSEDHALKPWQVVGTTFCVGVVGK